MTAGPAAESWEQWTSRVAAELGDLTEGDWLTVTAVPDASTGAVETTGGSSSYAVSTPERERRWSLRRGSSAPSAQRSRVADVFLQARLLEGVLALECISDTEFEGLSDLSPEQEQALVALGWERDRHGPDFHRTYALGTGHGEGSPSPAAREGAATEAARFLRQSLEQVLGAVAPGDVTLRRSASRS
jgi:hypothetical protein